MKRSMRIQKLEPSQRKEGRFLVHLEDGSILRVGEGEVVAFALYSGMELEKETLERLTAAAKTGGLKERALNALTARPMSRKELIKKLREKEAGEAEAEEIADWLERLGLLNDETYAAILVRHYSAKGYGPYKIRDELYRRGVPKGLWDSAMEELNSPDAAIDAFLRGRFKGETPDRKELKKASDALARKGFRWQDISAGLRRYGVEDE